MERAVIEYAVNALWQLPLLAAGAWLLLWMVRPGPAAQHKVWLGVLGLGLALPLYGIGHGDASASSAQAQATVEPAAAPSSMFPATAFDGAGEPGGLVLGQWAATGGHEIPVRTLAERVRRIKMNATAARWIAGLYLVLMIAGIARLARAWYAARRLLKESREFALAGDEGAMLEDCARRFRVKTPKVGISGEIQGPVVIGVVNPTLLWPESFDRDAAQHSSEEVMAVLCHEMAHIRRRDYLMNLVCEAAALPLKWHPVTYGVERRIRSTREMACDAMAAEAMESDVKYANCLLSLAQSMVTGRGMAAAVGLFNGNALEERLMRLTEARTAMSLRARVMRGAAGLAAMAGAVVLAGMFHVVPAMAQEQSLPALPPPPTVPVVLEQSTPANTRPQTGTSVPPDESITTSGSMDSVAAPQAVPEPAPKAAPAPVPETASEPLPQAAQEPAPKAAPEATPAPKKIVQDDVWVNGERHELTPEERARIEAQLAEAQKRIAAETARLTNGEIQRQIDEAQRKAREELDSAQLQQKMADAQRRIAEAQARLNSPEFQKQIEDAQKQACRAAQKIDRAEIQKQLAEAQKQIAAQTARVNSPEFRKQIEEAAQAAAKVNRAEIQRQLAEAQKQIADELTKMKAEDETQPTK